MTTTRSLVRAFALVGLLALALVAGACGDSDGGGDATASVADTPDKEALVKAYEELHDAYVAGNGKRFCSGLTRATARTTGKLFDSTCVRFINEHGKPRPPDGHNAGRTPHKSKVVGVEIDGQQGTVLYRQEAGGRPGTSEFVKRDGRWLGAWRPVRITGKDAVKLNKLNRPDTP